MLTFSTVSGVNGEALIVSNKKGSLGRISVGGRWPGRWRSWANSDRRSASPEEMMEIAKKCAELAKK